MGAGVEQQLRCLGANMENSEAGGAGRRKTRAVSVSALFCPWVTVPLCLCQKKPQPCLAVHSHGYYAPLVPSLCSPDMPPLNTTLTPVPDRLFSAARPGWGSRP